jgi:ethanolamine utilization protein EutN
MFLGKVIGTVVSTQKDQNFVGRKLLVVDICDESGKRKSVIAVDAVGAGVGDQVVVLVEGGSARMIMNAPNNTVVAVIIDSLSINE